jgi:hypothetical protein
MTDETPKVDQPLPEQATEGDEQRAGAARTNAYIELAKITAQLMKAALSICELPLVMPSGGVGKIVVAASPIDLAAVIESQEHRLKQLEIALNVLMDMMLQVDFVAAVDNPTYDATDPNSPMKTLKSAEINRTNFYLACAAAAERTASLMRRALLSQGGNLQGGIPGIVGGILRKPS